MLDIVVYEDNKKFMTKNINGINLALSKYDIDYRIHKYGNYNEDFKQVIRDECDNKIYILSTSVNGKSGIEVADKIREYDWNSIIIITSALDKYIDNVFFTRLMALDFIRKDSDYEKRLMDDIRMAISIFDRDKLFTFKYNHVIYRIPYSHICYIEKEPIIKRCIIHTLNNQYYITGSINKILTKLTDDFCRTHQSCIVNLNNIRKIDLKTNTILFKNDEMINMLTEKMKKEIKKYVGVDN